MNINKIKIKFEQDSKRYGVKSHDDDVDKVKFEQDLKKYGIKSNKDGDLYRKLFFITNTDSEKLGKEFNYKIESYDLGGIYDGDYVEIMLYGSDEDKCTFKVLNKRTLNEGEVVISIDDYEWYEQASYYEKVSEDIARLIKVGGVSDVKIHYNMWFIIDECIMYIAGCERLKDEVLALKYINGSDCMKEESSDFRPCDTLLLYSSYGLRVIGDNFDKFKGILDEYELTMKGLFYPKEDFYGIDGDSIYRDGPLFRNEGRANGLYIDISIETRDDYNERVVDAVNEIHEELGIKPTIIAEHDLISEKTDDYMEEGIDYVFIKGLDKARLLLSEFYKTPQRYIENFRKNISPCMYCLEEYDGYYSIDKYRLSDTKFNVYVEIKNERHEKRTLQVYTVDVSKFTEEEINFAMAMSEAYGVADIGDATCKEYRELKRACMSEDMYEDFNSLIAGYLVLYKLIVWDDDMREGVNDDEREEDWDWYPGEKGLRSKIKRYLKEKEIQVDAIIGDSVYDEIVAIETL